MNINFRPLLRGIAFVILLIASHSASAFYDPSIGKWLSRDPIGERGGANLYALVGNNSINQIDGVGNCCCCADDMYLSNIKRLFGAGTFGHSFDLQLILQYKSGCRDGDCSFVWDELSDSPSPDVLNAGGKPYEWFHVMDHGGFIAKIKWDTKDDVCPGLLGVKIPDAPQIYDRAYSERVIFWYFALTSSKGCRCDHNSISLTAKQTLREDASGNIVTQEFVQLQKNMN